jgi:pilus assembly protein Flp/PilA
MTTILRNWAADEAGATSIEYAFIASLIAMVIIGAVAALGTNLKVPYQSVADGLK